MPEGWHLASIDSICRRISSGGTPSREQSSYFEGGNIRWLKSQELRDCAIDRSEEKITQEGLSSSSAKMYPPNTVLVAMYGATVGKLGYLRVESSINQAICALITKTDTADSKYLFYALIATRHRLITKAFGAAQQNLNQELVKHHEIPLPPLSLQQKISSILSYHDDFIENNSRRITILGEMARAIYREWFVHFRFPGHEKVEMVDSELGEIPEGWRVKPFTEMVEVLSGGTPRTHKSEYWNGSIPFFTPRDIKDGFYILDTERHITKLGLDSCRSENFPKETVFITARGTVGRVVMPAAPMAMSQTSYALRGRNGIEQSFVFYKTLECVEQLKKMTHGAVFDTIITDTFRMLKINLPPLKLVKSFCTIISPLLDLILSQIKQNSALQKTRDILLPKLVSGQVDVSGLKIEIPADTLTTHKPSYQSTLDN